MKTEESVKVLMKLGFTLDQARIYLALVQEGPATTKKMAEISKIAQPDIYRIIPTLLKEGAVEKLITKPVSFRAIPMKQVLPAILKHKTAAQNELKKKTKELLSNLEKTKANCVQEKNGEFIILSGKEAVVRRHKEELLKAQIDVCLLTSQSRFSVTILEMEETYQEILKKGVQIKIAVDRHVPHEKILKEIQKLTENPNFEVKYFEGPPTMLIAIFDDKLATIGLFPTGSLQEMSGIWSNNTSFVALTKKYFEDKWNHISD